MNTIFGQKVLYDTISSLIQSGMSTLQIVQKCMQLYGYNFPDKNLTDWKNAIETIVKENNSIQNYSTSKSQDLTEKSDLKDEPNLVSEIHYYDLEIGDICYTSDNKYIQVSDKDRLCYEILCTTSRNRTIRTISRKLYLEFIEYLYKNPKATSSILYAELCGNSNIDKIEYHYYATLYAMAKYSLEKKPNSIFKIHEASLSTPKYLIDQFSDSKDNIDSIAYATHMDQVDEIIIDSDTTEDVKNPNSSSSDFIQKIDPPSRHGYSWSEEEDKEVTRLFKKGESYDLIATSMGRTESSIMYRLEKLGLINRLFGSKVDIPAKSNEATIILTKEIIDSARTPNGGFTKSQLAAIGIEWPAPKDWIKEKIGTKITSSQLDKFNHIEYIGKTTVNSIFKKERRTYAEVAFNSLEKKRMKAILSALSHFDVPVSPRDIARTIRRSEWEDNNIREDAVDSFLKRMPEVEYIQWGKYILKNKLDKY